MADTAHLPPFPLPDVVVFKEKAAMPLLSRMQKLVLEITNMPVSLSSLGASDSSTRHSYFLHRANYIDQLRKLILPVNARMLTSLESASAFASFFAVLDVLCYCRGSQPHKDIMVKANPRSALGPAIYDSLPHQGQHRLCNMFEDLLSQLHIIEEHGYRLCSTSLTDAQGAELGLFVSAEAVPAEIAAILETVRALNREQELLGEITSIGKVSVASYKARLNSLYHQLDYAFLLHKSVPVVVDGAYETCSANPSETQLRRSDWLMDTGAMPHLCCDRSSFTNYRPLDQPSELEGVGRGFFTLGHGDVTLAVFHGDRIRTITLRDVVHCPQMSWNILSGWKLNAANTTLSTIIGYAALIDLDTHEVIATGHGDRGLWWLDVSTGPSSLIKMYHM